ncbi:SCO family protein [Sphingobacterium sp. UT-1RO-CII-1]|uniref:SCO family protein n=1 Tax=Sphingobacterium sp. UT-1RO-CII-1 TaxID=2995225 RepID=UPI00227B3E3B|nr:SCO family protein [Sphingobacterium sp. UT-1RO-CII-1]MCY4779466.1 SCO family protein [Sphingobacterium sp. UT-1RO-CII-1]
MKSYLKFNFIALAISVFLISCSSNGNEKKLPYIGESTVNEKTVDGQTVTDTIPYAIPSFSFLNQDSVMITDKTFENKIFIANFFFTNCPSICPTMQRNLLQVYEKYKDDDRVAFLSHSIDFKYDSPAVLKSYAEKLGVTDDRWQFVMGSKKDIYGMADSYFVYTKEDETAPGGYDHQGYFMLIDKNKHIRGAYDGTLIDQIDLLLADMEVLLKEQ